MMHLAQDRNKLLDFVDTITNRLVLQIEGKFLTS